MSLKIDYISDLHLDFYIKSKNPDDKKAKLGIIEFIGFILNRALPPGDVLIIAGDLGHYNSQIRLLLIELKKIYKHVIVTFGNHDLYMISNNIMKKYKGKSENRLIELEEICRELDVHYLNGQVIEIDGVRIGGTGSWYDLKTSEDLVLWNKIMNDSNLIYKGNERPSNGMYSMYNSRVSSNWDPIKFWEQEREKLERVAKEKCHVFVTHVALNYAPDEIMHPEYVGDKSNLFYYTNNLDILKESGCKVHIHGHTHQKFEYEVDGIRVYCNPLGYAGENPFCMIQQLEI